MEPETLISLSLNLEKCPQLILNIHYAAYFYTNFISNIYLLTPSLILRCFLQLAI